MVWEGTESLKEKRCRAKSDVSEVRSRTGLGANGDWEDRGLRFWFSSEPGQGRGAGWPLTNRLEG